MPDIRFNCPRCNHSYEAPNKMDGEMINCPSCNNLILAAASSVPPDKGNESKLEKKHNLFGLGALICLAGLVFCFLAFPFGLIFGIVLLIVGNRYDNKYVCSICGNKAEDKDVKICPVCKAEFK